MSVVDWEAGLPPMTRPNRILLVMILDREEALGVVIETCFTIGEDSGVVAAKGDFREKSVVRDLFGVALCELSRESLRSDGMFSGGTGDVM